ncbi:MAG: DUF4296 domain-containing protein [Chitinophagales bacterium]
MKQVIPFLFMFLSACKPELPSVPKDIIPMEQMKPILMDMHMADAVAETKAQNGASEGALTAQYTEQILKLHHVSREEFTKSYHFYEVNPILMNKMYEEILNEMSKREADMSKQQFNNKK